MRKIGIFLLLAITGLLNAAEQNLIFNGDFRLGTAGFGVWRLLRPDTNPELQLPPCGRNRASFCWKIPTENIFSLSARSVCCRPGEKITFRSEFEGPAGGVLGFTMLCIKNNQYITHHKGVALSGKKTAGGDLIFPRQRRDSVYHGNLPPRGRRLQPAPSASTPSLWAGIGRHRCLPRSERKRSSTFRRKRTPAASGRKSPTPPQRRRAAPSRWKFSTPPATK
ncbi:MAG: hypothetical protein L6W00_28335 [Lentisphaeria bacterium]|nr:MAG: hypothetical protein L6W00_28335 [Lentisphaeria bacterium]